MTTKKPKNKLKKRKAKNVNQPLFSVQNLRRFGLVFAVFAVLTGAAFAWLFFDFAALPRQVADAGTAMVRGAGFKVETIELRGSGRFSEDQIRRIIDINHDATIFVQDVAQIRQNLEAQTWVAQARVVRKLPDTLSLDIIEHRPFARWQLNGEIRLVNDMGNAFMLVRPNEWREFPLIVGPGATDAVHELATALETYPEIARRLTSATRIGRRRWDLAFRSGALVKLPEDNVSEKLAQLSVMQRDNGLLDGPVMRIDMRMDHMLAISADRAAPTRERGSDAAEISGR